MATIDIPEMQTLFLIGMCLLVVQQAEGVLASSVRNVFDQPDLNLMEQTELERKQTLGEFIKKLKQRAKVELVLKDKLYRFLKMRNKFVHNLSEVPGWNLKTDEGREVATAFLAELACASLAITALFTTVGLISAKDRHGIDLFEGDQIAEALEEHFGTPAKKLLAGRYGRPTLVRSEGAD